MSEQQRPRRLYDALAVGSALAADLGELLAARPAFAHLTVCPDCGASEFTHELGCPTFARVQSEIVTALATYERSSDKRSA